MNDLKYFVLVELFEFKNHSNSIKTLLKKSHDSFNILSFDMQESILERNSQYDNFLLVIWGNLRVTTLGKTTTIFRGQSFVFPSNQPYLIELERICSFLISSIKYDENE